MTLTVPDPYTKIFGRETSLSWDERTEHNLFFLKAHQQYFTDMLQVQKYLLLNSVFSGLGLPHTREGIILGWVLNVGDNYVDFGINEPKIAENGDITLNFNCAGIVYDLIKTRTEAFPQ